MKSGHWAVTVSGEELSQASGLPTEGLGPSPDLYLASSLTLSSCPYEQCPDSLGHSHTGDLRKPCSSLHNSSPSEKEMWLLRAHVTPAGLG